jgi:octaprenyl-diphosphate synthase
MTLQPALDALADVTGGPDLASPRTGARAVERLGDVRALVARDMADVEARIEDAIARGVAPATDSARHLAGSGGKRVRPLAVLLATACFGAVGARAKDLAAVAELVHTATLLHDDVIDDGDLRRGRPASRRVWGNAVSVLAGDLLLVESLRLASGASRETWSELLATLRSLVDGEVVQLRGRLAVSLDEATYFEIVRGKTASLFEWALRAGAREAGADPDAIDALGAFGAHLGVAFQLVDDVLDYADGGETGKTVLADLAEGKVTLPLLRAARRWPEIVPLVARVREGGGEGNGEGAAAAADRIAEIVRASGACDEARALAVRETDAAVAALDRVPPCTARDILAGVARDLASRVA